MTTTSSVMRVVPEDLLPANLRVALLYFPDRFPDYAVGACVGVSARLDLPVHEWVRLLERVSVALAPLFCEPS